VTADLEALRWERIERAARDTLERVQVALRDRYGATDLPIRVRDAIEEGILWAARAGEPVLRVAPRMSIAPLEPANPVPLGMPRPPPPKPARAPAPPPGPLQRAKPREMDVEDWELEWDDHQATTTEFKIDGEETGRYSVRALKKPPRRR
jgi:hypothetical protein